MWFIFICIMVDWFPVLILTKGPQHLMK
jgi:hypothetical protein